MKNKNGIYDIYYLYTDDEQNYSGEKHIYERPRQIHHTYPNKERPWKEISKSNFMLLCSLRNYFQVNWHVW